MQRKACFIHCSFNSISFLVNNIDMRKKIEIVLHQKYIAINFNAQKIADQSNNSKRMKFQLPNTKHKT